MKLVQNIWIFYSRFHFVTKFFLSKNEFKRKIETKLKLAKGAIFKSLKKASGLRIGQSGRPVKPALGQR